MAILDQVEQGLRHYVVPILGLWDNRPIPDLRLIGTGTLIEVDGQGCILTAGHVWGTAITADSLHFLLMPNRVRVELSVDDIEARTNWRRDHPEEWGPDLALLEIPTEKLGAFKACKSFLDFERQRTDVSRNPPKTEKGLWAVYGVVSDFSSVTVDPENRSLDAQLVARAFFGGIVGTHSNMGYDYYDTRADMVLPGVPGSFGGVSGGGLWEVGLTISKTGVISWKGERHFRGVAFWESSVKEQQRIVRCHGPSSIFQQSWV